MMMIFTKYNIQSDHDVWAHRNSFALHDGRDLIADAISSYLLVYGCYLSRARSIPTYIYI